jgi:DNA-binding CsgD family transcriptional regulator
VRPRAVVIAHRQRMYAEGLRAALAKFPAIAPTAAVTAARQLDGLAARADAVAIDAELPGAVAVAARMRYAGLRVVWIGPVDADNDEVRIAPEAPVSALAEALVPGSVKPTSTPLSVQQRRILSLVAQGMTAKQVARSLAISVKTVEQHKHRIFKKLGVPNQAAAVRVALSHDLEGVPA